MVHILYWLLKLVEPELLSYSSDGTRGFLVPRAWADLAEVLVLSALENHVVPLLLWEEKVFPVLEDVIPHCVLQYGARVLHNQLVDQNACDVLMLKSSASEPGTRTLFSFGLGTETYRVSLGLASLRSKVMCLTARSAFIVLRFFSLCVGWRFACTAIFIMHSTIKC